MKSTTKALFVGALVIVGVSLAYGYVFAQGGLQQPQVPISGQALTLTRVKETINLIVNTLMSIGVVIGIGYFVLGAINNIMNTSYLAGEKGSGKNQMKQAAWGIAAILAVGLVVQTISRIIITQNFG
jgi:hypothetical protein